MTIWSKATLLLIKAQWNKPKIQMFGVVALVKAENFTNLLDLQSVIEHEFIHMKN